MTKTLTIEEAVAIYQECMMSSINNGPCILEDCPIFRDGCASLDKLDRWLDKKKKEKGNE